MLDFVRQHSLDDFYRIGERQFPRIVEAVYAAQPGDFGLEPDEERGLPGEMRYRETGWSRKMMGRYFAAGLLCRKRNVLELCSGLGWGAYILSHLAARVTCLELDGAISKSAETYWKKENILWKEGDALACATMFPEAGFSAVTFMEALEHFDRDAGFAMIKNIHHLLQDEGILVASSYFPSTREEADAVCRNNKHHLYIFTEQEIKACCNALFRQSFIVNKLLLVAVK